MCNREWPLSWLGCRVLKAQMVSTASPKRQNHHTRQDLWTSAPTLSRRDWLGRGIAVLWGLGFLKRRAYAGKIHPDHPLAPALELAYKSHEALKDVHDYEAQFEKREMIGRRLQSARMTLKLRERPFSVYLLFHEPHQGREVIYVEGRNNGMLLAHETGLKSIAGTVTRAPDSADAMRDNRYPITMIGLRNMLQRVITQWEEEGEYGETEVKYYPQAKLGDLALRAIESSHPQPRKQFRFHKTRLYLDRDTLLPVRVEQYDFPKRKGDEPPLVEEYTYTQLKINIGLTDMDFDVRNPRYAFP